jgi:hypothetical protein
MVDEGPLRPEPDLSVRQVDRFTIAGRVTDWDPIAREMTITGRVLSVGAMVFVGGDVAAGVSIVASGYRASDPTNRWVVTRLRVS